jgi:hypothetical protein
MPYGLTPGLSWRFGAGSYGHMNDAKHRKFRQKKRCSTRFCWLDWSMDLEVESRVVCPYCGAVFTTVVDTSSGAFSTIEDCEICCRPIALNVHCHYGEIESVEFDRA